MRIDECVAYLRRAGITPKAVAYTRYSSDNQREESIDAQLRGIRSFAASLGLPIIHEYIDRAKSATTDDREEFQQMIADSAKREFQFVLVHKLDRFARKRSDSLGYRVRLKSNGVVVVSVLEHFDSDTPEGMLMEGMIELMAEFYSRNLAREVSKGLRENAFKAKFNGGKPPYGYDVDPLTQKYVINVDEAAAVKMIFEMVAKHYSYGEILDAIHAAGFRTKLGNYFKRTSLYDILRNPRYTGLYVYMRVKSKDYLTNTRNNHAYNVDAIKVPDGIPAIIDQALFDEVQQILDKRKCTRKRLAREKYILSGKIFCGECGSPYSGDKTLLRSGKPFVTYRCLSRKNKAGHKCDNKGIRRENIEMAVLKMIESTMLSDDLIPTLQEKYNEAIARVDSQTVEKLNNLNSRKESVSKSINNIVVAVERSASLSLVDRLTELEKQKVQIEAQIEKVKLESTVEPVNEERIRALVANCRALLYDKNFTARVRVVDKFVDRILVFKNRVEITLNVAPFVSQGDYAMCSQTIER